MVRLILQGIMLEKMIRERCEGTTAQMSTNEQGHPTVAAVSAVAATAKAPPANTKEVEDLILQLFEIVNEKNELFRRQAELMYLYVFILYFLFFYHIWLVFVLNVHSRRLHRLEQEQADIEYEIRVLMAQPERNKTDSDKAREEGLIARKVEVNL